MLEEAYNKDVLENFFSEQLKEFILKPLTNTAPRTSLNDKFVQMIKRWSLLNIPGDAEGRDCIPSAAIVSTYLSDLLWDPAKKKFTVSSLLEIYVILLAIVAGKISGPVSRSDVAELDFTCYMANPGHSMTPGRLNILLDAYVDRRKFEAHQPFVYKPGSPYPLCVQQYSYAQDNMDLSDLRALRDHNSIPPTGASPLMIDVKIFRDEDQDDHIKKKVADKLDHQDSTKRADYVVVLNSLTNKTRLNDLFSGDSKIIVVEDWFRDWRSMVAAGIIT
jgi:hypothetical protein